MTKILHIALATQDGGTSQEFPFAQAGVHGDMQPREIVATVNQQLFPTRNLSNYVARYTPEGDIVMHTPAVYG